MESLYEKSKELLEKRYSQEVITLLEDNLLMAKKDPFLYQLKAEAFIQESNYDEAIKYCNLGLEINSCVSDLWMMLAYSSEKKLDYQSALKHYEKVIKISPNYDAAYNNIGVLYSDHFKNDKYEDFLNTSINSKSNDEISFDYYTQAHNLNKNEKIYLDNLEYIVHKLLDQNKFDYYLKYLRLRHVDKKEELLVTPKFKYNPIYFIFDVIIRSLIFYFYLKNSIGFIIFIILNFALFFIELYYPPRLRQQS